MKFQQITIMTILAAFILAGPALAVKKVPKSNDSSSIDKQDDVNQNSSGSNQPATGPGNRPDNSSQGNRDDKPDKPNRPERVAEPPKPQTPDSRGNDNFKDDDGDGLNDNIKKPPEIVKKKRESNSNESKEDNRSR